MNILGKWAIGFSLYVALCATCISAPNERINFLEREAFFEGQPYRYRVYVPSDWTGDQEWPVILFLHGAGERGSDNRAQTRVGIGPAIEQNPERFQTVVVMPQCEKGVWWNDRRMEGQALQALDQSIKEFRGDPTRVYLSGLSMGGYGTFYLGARYPEKFAALAPICGGVVPPRRASRNAPPAVKYPYRDAATRIAPVPVWIFHGAADPVVPVTESRKMSKALQSAGSEVRYTEYEGVRHNSWDPAYAEPELMDWMLSKKRDRNR